MSECAQVQAELEQLRTGELPSEAESTVRAHLQECPLCAKEAILLEAFGDRISKGLREWVEAGTVPPMLAAQIEASIRVESKPQRGRWARWRVPLGVAAAAVLMVAVTASMGSEWSQQLAAAGGVGGLFQTFLGRPMEDRFVQVEVGPSDPVHNMFVNKTAERHGMTVRVEAVEYDSNQTKVAYSISGDGFQLDGSPDLSRLMPILLDGQTPVPFRNVTVQQQDGAYLFQAFFDPVGETNDLTFRIDQLPRGGQGAGAQYEQGPWEIQFGDQ